MKEKYLTGVRKVGEKYVKINVQVFLFREAGIHYAYLPSLELTGYGYTEEEAKKSLETTLYEFLRYTINKNTFFLEFQRLGWKIKSKKQPLIAPKTSDLINTNDYLREIVNKKQYTTSIYPVNVPAFA